MSMKHRPEGLSQVIGKEQCVCVCVCVSVSVSVCVCVSVCFCVATSQMVHSAWRIGQSSLGLHLSMKAKGGPFVILWFNVTFNKACTGGHNNT